MNQPTQPSTLPEGVWQTLLGHAFALVDEIAQRGIRDPFWTFGGGTVLMLRHGHRLRFGVKIFKVRLPCQPDRSRFFALCNRGR